MFVAPLASVNAQGDDGIQANFRTSGVHEVRLGTYVSWNSACQRQGTPTIEVTQAPAFGTTSLKPGTKTARDNLVGGTSCTGIKFDGVSFFYRPDPGFEGDDVVRYDVHILDKKPLHFTAHIQVRAGRTDGSASD